MAKTGNPAKSASKALVIQKRIRPNEKNISDTAKVSIKSIDNSSENGVCQYWKCIIVACSSYLIRSLMVI